LTEIFTLIKNTCFDNKICPDPFLSQAEAVLENGIAIPYSKAILTRRKKFNLPEIKTAPLEEIKKILDFTNFERNISGRDIPDGK